MQEPIYNNGTVKVAKEGVSAYLAWYRTLSMADAKEISDVCSRLTKEAAKNAGVDLYDIGRNTFSFFGHQTEENWEKQRASVSEKMLQFFHFAEEFEQPIRAALWSKEAAFLYIGNPQKGIIVMEPEKYMTYTPDRDYSDLTPAQAMAELGSAAVCDMSIIPVGAGTALSQKTVKEQLSTHQTEIEKLKSEMKDVEGAKTGELAELTAQIEALKHLPAGLPNLCHPLLCRRSRQFHPHPLRQERAGHGAYRRASETSLPRRGFREARVPV